MVNYKPISGFIHPPVRFIWLYPHAYDNEYQGGVGLNSGYSVTDAGSLEP